MKKNRISKYFRYFVFAISSTIVAITFTWLILAQEVTNQDSQKVNTKIAEVNLAEELGKFRGTISTEDKKGEGNRIVAIRQISIIVDDIDSEGRSIKRKLPRIEIELFSKFRPPVTNSAHHVVIGDKFFYVGGRGCEEKFGCIMVVLTLEEFENLKDNSLVTYHIGGVIEPSILEEADKNGKLGQVIGTYFGKLNKALLDKSSNIERIVVQQ